MTPPDPGLDPLVRRVRRHHSRMMPLARAALIWERLWPRLWPTVGIIGAFLALAMFDVLPLLPFWLHGVLLFGFAAAMVVALYLGLRSFRVPTGQEIRARIERDSQLPHHPLAVMDDSIAVGKGIESAEESAMRVLWQEHRRRATQACKRLRLAVPSPGLARLDPYGIRFIIVLVLIISAAAGAGDASERMARALLPENRGLAVDTRVDLWVTPPGYTGFPPFHVFLGPVVFDKNDTIAGTAANRAGDFVAVRTIPVGSSLLIQAAGISEPTLVMAAREIDLNPINAPQNDAMSYGETGYRLQTTAGLSDVQTDVTTIAIRSGDREIVSWRVQIIDDQFPRIDFTQAPVNTGRGRLRIAFAAEDDFGLETATLVIRNPALPAGSEDGDTVRLNLPLSLPRAGLTRASLPRSALTDGAVSIETAVLRDLSEHDWSGLPVELRLEASDALGQIGHSDSLSMVLPERIFNHPVARALADFRKHLVVPSAEMVADVIDGLDDLLIRPEHFNHDQVVYLAIRVARARLIYDDSPQSMASDVLTQENMNPAAMKSVRTLLWRTALRIEDGEFALAGRELSEVQEALEQALRDGAFTEAVERLLNALDQALDRFLTALDSQLDEKGMQDLSDIPGLSYMDEAALKQMIKDARELARAGSVEAAQATLAELQGLLQAIESAMNSDQPMDQFSEIRDMMQTLSGISMDQQDLLDQTFRQMRRSNGISSEIGSGIDGIIDGNENGEPSPEDATRSYAHTQDELRLQLGDLMLGLDPLIGLLPEGMLDAKDAMGRAVESLQDADPGGAIVHQSKALEALHRATEQVSEQIARQLRALPGNMPAARGTVPNNNNDPFGRMGGGATGRQMDDGLVKVPSQMEMRRAREIYEELRRRAGNPNRPVVERDYIHRLLRQF
ncbi:MAG: TIGR02302 family protein [Rhodospirillales bacterium]|nr:TIGR02302 family protein [Rhodospirillales bacterium]